MLKISSDIEINIQQIIDLQSKYNKELKEIEEKKIIKNFDVEIENIIFKMISNSMEKYEKIIHNYFKIKKKKEKKEIIEKLINDIFNFVHFEIKSNNPINIDLFIKKLHKIIFPNGIWGETMSPSGQRYYKNYESGKYRDTKEFISVGGNAVFFTNPNEINDSLNKLIEGIFHNNEIHNINKIIIFIFYFWKIHPFNDGNGTIAEILYIVLNLKMSYKIDSLNYKEYFIDENNGFFYDKNNVDFDNIFKKYYEYLLKN